mmetsp:Transcript_14442/g.31284  ORF Transcript_14442/g.31284 Transcript_14442/m.31284 type:complete len:280 (+) Transcript_14442:227-1066(+)
MSACMQPPSGCTSLAHAPSSLDLIQRVGKPPCVCRPKVEGAGADNDAHYFELVAVGGSPLQHLDLHGALLVRRDVDAHIVGLGGVVVPTPLQQYRGTAAARYAGQLCISYVLIRPKISKEHLHRADRDVDPLALHVIEPSPHITRLLRADALLAPLVGGGSCRALRRLLGRLPGSFLCSIDLLRGGRLHVAVERGVKLDDQCRANGVCHVANLSSVFVALIHKLEALGLSDQQLQISSSHTKPVRVLIVVGYEWWWKGRRLVPLLRELLHILVELVAPE